ncbi:MAG TPA: SigE family RNA polymerase sigma factor [Trebonia sp.]
MRRTEYAMSTRDEEFQEFMRNRASTLHQSAYLLCGDWHLADDLVQDTFIKAYRHWPRIRGMDIPDAYVRRILVNEVRGRWRRRMRVIPVARFPEGREQTVPDATEAFTQQAGMLQILITLPLRQRATIVLRYLEGMSERETADVLGCSVGTVKSQSARALATLRKALDRTESTL